MGELSDGAEAVEDGGRAVGVEWLAVAGGEDKAGFVPAWAGEGLFSRFCRRRWCSRMAMAGSVRVMVRFEVGFWAG